MQIAASALAGRFCHMTSAQCLPNSSIDPGVDGKLIVLKEYAMNQKLELEDDLQPLVL